jgi:Fic family protein
MIKHLHRLSMSGIDPQPGVFRKEQTAIFNQAGVAVYITPPATEIEGRLESLFGTLQKSSGPVTADAALAHIWFEKIHPFVDGNGRVGRLLMAYWLQMNDFGFDGLLAVEKIIEKRKSEYYALLAPSVAEVTPFVEFMGECLVETAEAMMDQLKKPRATAIEDDLMPRQREMYLIIKDHIEVSFDFIRRRFLSVPESTLHYDLKQLMKKELVKKIGITRGSRYRLKG